MNNECAARLMRKNWFKTKKIMIDIIDIFTILIAHPLHIYSNCREDGMQTQQDAH